MPKVIGSRQKNANRWYLFLLLLGLVPICLIGWIVYYQVQSYACFSWRTGCDRVVATEEFVCAHNLPGTFLFGGCGSLGARYLTGGEVPRDVSRAMDLLEKACFNRFERYGEGGCLLLSFKYQEAFDSPRYVMIWGGHGDEPTWESLGHPGVNRTLVDAEHRCATDFPGEKLERQRHDLLRTFCSALPNARLAVAHAHKEGPTFVRSCESGHKQGCLLAGIVLALGVGVPRDLERGKALLKRACDQGSTTACGVLKRGTW
mgnify:CR=1 FL=1